MINKEYGSDFHFYQKTESIYEHSQFSGNQVSLFFSGRVALFNLLSFGIKEYEWDRVGFPSYYCHEVVDFCRKLPIEVHYYMYNPFQPQIFDWDDDRKNVFINVDFFGINKLDTSFLEKSIVIEDVTHNILNYKKSDARFCFGSLRKQLPLPVGGFTVDHYNNFNPQNKINNFSEDVALQKLSAMHLKSNYLKGKFKEKEIFRSLFIEAEKSFESFESNTSMPDIGKSIFLKLPHKRLIKKTRDNIQFAKALWKRNDKVELLTNSQGNEMGLMLLCENRNFRDSLKTHLINHKIYPAILWPNQKNELDIKFENKVLFVHADFRYDTEDIQYIVDQINNFTAHV